MVPPATDARIYQRFAHCGVIFGLSGSGVTSFCVVCNSGG